MAGDGTTPDPGSNDAIIAGVQNGTYGANTGATFGAAPVAKVYLGQNHDAVDSKFGNKQVADEGNAADRIENHPSSAHVSDVDSASAAIYGWTDERLKKWEKLLLANGLIKPGEYNYEDLVAAWGSAVKGASNLFAAGKKVTPEQYVDVYVGSSFSGGKAAATDPDRTSTSYQTVDDLDARAAAEDAYKAFLGTGNVTGRQAGAVKAALQAYADAHPSISTTHTQKDGDTVTRSHGGMSADAAGQIVEDTVKAKPNYAEFQAATTVHRWLTDALGPAVSGY